MWTHERDVNISDISCAYQMIGDLFKLCQFDTEMSTHIGQFQTSIADFVTCSRLHKMFGSIMSALTKQWARLVLVAPAWWGRWSWWQGHLKKERKERGKENIECPTLYRFSTFCPTPVSSSTSCSFFLLIIVWPEIASFSLIVVLIANHFSQISTVPFLKLLYLYCKSFFPSYENGVHLQV